MKSIQSLDHLSNRRGGSATLRRLRWIDARLHWIGEMTRGELVRRFSISPSQASADLAAYREAAPENLVLDHADKRIKATSAFRSIFTQDARAWLEEEREAGATDMPDVVRASDPWAVVSDDVLRAIVRAASTRTCVSVVYVSVSSGKVGRRTLSPHSIVDVGDRLHARAFDHGRGRFGDFVLARMSGPAEEQDAPWVDASADAAWRELTALTIGPRDGVGDAHAAAAMAELGLPPSGGIIPLSEALAFYTLKRLDLIDVAGGRYVCRNVDDLPESISRLTKKPDRE